MTATVYIGRVALKTSPGKRRAPRALQHTMYAYEVTPDRITAFASGMAANGKLTVFSPKPVDGLRLLELHHVMLPDGTHATTVTSGDRDANVGFAAPLPADAYKPDARARAILRGIDYARADLSDAGGAFTLDEVQSLLGVSRQAVVKRVKEGSLLAVPGPSNRRVYPTAQFENDGSIVPGLRDVIGAHPSRNMWAVLGFLINGRHDLDGARPIDLLRAGRWADVVAAARNVGEQSG